MSAFLRKYNTATAAATHIRIPMVVAGEVNFAGSGDWTPATGDVKISEDGAAQANIGTLPTFVNGSWQFEFTGAELSAKTIDVVIIDSATKAVEDQMFKIETFGNASAMYPYDLSDAVRLGLTALPNAVADAAGGLPISDAGGLDMDSIKTDTAAITTLQADTDDIQTRLPAALVSGRMSSDAVSISGSTDAADKLEASAEVLITGAAEAGTLSTTQMTTDLTEATDDHYIGRSVIWTSGVLLGQAKEITDYAGATGLLTYTAATEAPSAADTFVIV